MSQTQQYLLALSIGPVQGFIAAARKTRDLWFGSFLLSEISKAASRSIKDRCELIFPGINNEKDLEPESNLSVANVILAVVDHDPKSVAEDAKKAATDTWKRFAENAKQKVNNIANGKEVLQVIFWDSQINDFLEFQAAWTPLGEDYKASRDRVMRLLAGRKACRDFIPAQENDYGFPKSSLDGARETVLVKELPKDFQKHLHLREGESLDAIGVVKRFAGGRKSFPSLGLIAIDPIIRNRSDLKTTIQDEKIDWDDFDELNNAFPRIPEKSPYLAVILADGDKMGKAISECTNKEQHQQLSAALAGFAQSVPKTFENNHGICVYSGGDDVLGFLPLDKAIVCARELHDNFSSSMRTYGDVSLSVGIVVGHYHEMLENLLDYARKAEQDAKKTNGFSSKNDSRFGDRNGLAIWTYHRSGSPCGIREQWLEEENPTSLDNRLQSWAILFSKGKIPMKFPYDLRVLAQLFKGTKPEPEMIRKNAEQVAKQKQISQPELLDALNQLTTPESVQRLADEMMIAQTIGEALKLAGNNKGEKS